MILRANYLVILFIVLSFFVNGQESYTSDTFRVNSLLTNAQRILTSDSLSESQDSAKKLIDNALLISVKNNYIKGIIQSNIDMGNYYSLTEGNKILALSYFKKALGLSDSLGDSILIIGSKFEMANLYLDIDDSIGLDIAHECESFYLNRDDYRKLSSLYSIIALYYTVIANDGINSKLNYERSLDYHKKTIYMINKLKGKEKARELVNYYSNISIIYTSDRYYKKDILKAIDKLKKGKRIINKYGLKQSVPININLGNNYEILYKQNNQLSNYLDSALKYYAIGENIANTCNDSYFKEVAWGSMADVLYLKGEKANAINFLHKYYDQRNLRDSLKRSDEFDKNIAELKLEKQKKDLDEAKVREEAMLYSYKIYGGVFITIILLFILIFILGAVRERKLNKSIFEKSLVLKEQQEIIDEKNEEISQSIRYALKIQKAMSLSHEEINKIIGDSFILFKPKEDVSGDFYFIHQLDNDKVLIAVADSKSHGLPGAFMAMLGSSLLREAVVQDKLVRPGKILKTVSESIRRSLRQDEESIFRGIELSVCVLDRKEKELSYAGGFSSMYIVNNGVLSELKGDRILIGYSHKGDDDFTIHKQSVDTGSCIYLFTDGYTDQFGGNMGKKYKPLQFRNKLCTINKQDMKKQLISIKKEFEDWKGNYNQIDDVTVIGVRV